MLELGRVCVPIGLACDLDCKYCYRHMAKRRIPRLNDLMRRYLQQLDPSKTIAVVASGGEPLLYLNRVKELFSYVPDGIHLKIMSNGTHLTQEIVDWINDKDIELHFSHDGTATEYLRGVDVLKDEKLCSLIRQVNTLRVNSTICAGNEDIVANYEYIADLLERDDFYYTFMPFFGYEDETLLKNFNYDKYMLSYRQYVENVQSPLAFYKHAPSNGLNVLPDGSVCGITTMNIYGTVEDDMETILERKLEVGDFEACFGQKNCPIRDRCSFASQSATPHVCKCLRINTAVCDYLDFEKREE